MTTPHRATPFHWSEMVLTNFNSAPSCILELRDRLAAAEQRISELEGKQDTQRVGMLDVYQHLDKLKTKHESNWSRIVKLEEAADHLQDATQMVLAGSLVEVVQRAISDVEFPHGNDEARAAIRACADWLDAQVAGLGAACIAARWLREEVERG